jgi:amidase
MRLLRGVLAAAITAAVAIAQLGAVTRVPSADGQFWDVQDTSPWSQDSGGIATGGRSNPFNGFGYLKMQLRRAGSTPLVRNHYLRGFGLHHDGKGRFDSITPVFVEGVVVDRNITTQPHTNYLRYVDTFTNTTDQDRILQVAWGGAVGAYRDGGFAAVATTSDGDNTIEPHDSFVTMMQNVKEIAAPVDGPSGHGPSAHVIGNRKGLVTAIGDMYADPFENRWPGFDPAHVGYVFTLRLRPGQSSSLMTFVVKGAVNRTTRAAAIRCHSRTRSSPATPRTRARTRTFLPQAAR